MRLKLMLNRRDGSDEVTLFQSHGNTCMLGRKACDINIADAYCSQRHALFYQGVDGELRIRDLESTNGTYVDGNRVHDCALEKGDVIRIGKVFLSVVSFKPARLSSRRETVRGEESFHRGEAGTHTATRRWSEGSVVQVQSLATSLKD